MPAPPSALDALLRPRSIAVVGVPREPSRQPTMNGATVLASLERFGFAGAVHIVHPSGQPIGGRPTSASIAQLPVTPDLIVLALPAASIPQAVAEAGRRGIRGAVVMAAGFSELATADGVRLERALRDAADGHGVRLCGPNGLGYLNTCDRVLAGYFPCLLSDAAPQPGGLAIVTQSGAIGNSLLARAMDRRIGTSFVISSGNETNVSLAEYLEFLADDEHTRVVSLYLEGVVDGRGLRQALQRCADAGKPVVAYKVGKSASGARAAMSHTAKVAGEPALYRGLFRQLGVIEAARLDELLDIPMLLAKCAPLTGRPPAGVGVVSISGGLGAICADHLAAEGFALPELSAATQARLAALPVALGSTLNPVDTTAAIQRNEALLADILAIVAQDDAIDALVFPNAARFPGPALNVATLMADSARTLPKPLLSVWYAGVDNQAAMAALHASERVACFDDPAACARALAALRDVRAFAARPADGVLQPPPQAHAAVAATLRRAPATLNEVDAKAVLEAYGLALPREAFAADAAQAAEAAARLGWPVAMKVVSADVPHKARAGGVQLGLPTADALRRAHAGMLARVAAQCPQARLDGVLVSEMVAIRLELLVGAYRDAQFGPVLVVGIGGGAVESRPDVAMRLLPATRSDCRAALDALHDRRVLLLDAADKDAITQAVAAVAAMAWALRDTLAEVDVNPIALTADGRVLALDALMRLAPATPDEAPR